MFGSLLNVGDLIGSLSEEERSVLMAAIADMTPGEVDELLEEAERQ